MTAWVLVVGWGGGQPTSAQTLDGVVHPANANPADPVVRLGRISPAIPVYQGASYRPDLSQQALGKVRAEFGADADVLVLATDDSFPQVWHYYVLYLAQYRAWKAQPSYPRTSPKWRQLELDLNTVMRDPFIPGDSLDSPNRNVWLQVVETGSHPGTLIRYIVAPKRDETFMAGAQTAPAGRITKR